MSDNQSEEKGKVLQFPKSRSRSNGEMPSSTESLQMSRSRILAGVSLVFVFIGTAVLNSTLESGDLSTSSSGRTLASLSKNSEQRMDHLRWQHEMAEKVSLLKGREIASVGAKPSLRDSLQFGTLEGRYAVDFKKGKISEIHFNGDAQFEDPKLLKDRVSFIEKYRSLLPVIFTKAEMKGVLATSDLGTKEIYQLESDEGKVGEVEFNMDARGRLLSVTIK